VVQDTNQCIAKTSTVRRILGTNVMLHKKIKFYELKHDCVQLILHSLSVSVALVIQYAKRARRVVLSSVACPAVPYFPTLCCHKCACVFVLSTRYRC
jgi:hypothetical protein